MGDSSKSNVAMAPTPIAMDGGWGWVVVIGAFVVYFIADGWSYSFGLFYTDLLEYFHEGKGKTAVIAALLYGFPLLISPIICALVTSYGCRKIGVIGGFIFGVSFVFSAYAPSVDVLCVSVGVISSIGLSMGYISALVSVTYYFEKWRGLATGLAVTGSGLGAFAFPPMIEKMREFYSWSETLLILGGIGFNFIVAGALFRAPPMMRSEVEEDLKTDETELQPEESQNGSNERRPSQDGVNRQRDATSVDMSLRNKQLQHGISEGDQEERRLLGEGESCPRDPNDLSTNTAVVFKSNQSYQSRQKRPSTASVTQPIPKQSNLSTFWEELKVLVMSMMDKSLLYNFPYLLFIASNFILYLWVGVPYVYLLDRAIMSGIDEKKAPFLLSIIGITRTIGQLILGYLGDNKHVNTTALYAFSITAVGLITLLVPLFTVYPTMALFSIIFGFFVSVTYCLQMMVVVEIVGIAKATNAFGLVQLIQGIATLLGTPVAGWLFDRTGGYDPSFYMAGAMVMVSGLMILPLPCLIRRWREHQHQDPHHQDPHPQDSHHQDSHHSTQSATPCA